MLPRRCSIGLRSPVGLLLLALVAGWALPARLDARWLNVPPSLPAPTGRVVQVATEPELQQAMATLTNGTTVVIAPGTYQLTATLRFRGPLSDVTIRGATDSRDDVVLKGAGMTNANHGGVEFGIWTGGDVHRLTIANLTVRDFYTHPIIMNAGTQTPRMYNIRLVNGGEQLLKTNPSPDGSGINNGIIEHSVFEYDPQSRNWYANAIQVLAGTNWIIRDNLIRNIRAPQGEQAGPAVLAWFSASGTIVEGNTFINCQREIHLGLIEREPNDHYGGVIRNNFIYRDATVDGDVSIGVFDSPNTQVLNNTIYVETSYRNAIETRFPHTTNTLIANNLISHNKTIGVRDGAAQPTLQNNVFTATLDLFENAPAGNLHLVAGAAIARDTGVATAQATTDWDGDTRPIGTAPDIGADEYNPTPTTPPPPPPPPTHQPPAAPKNLRVVP
jgi:hypothetical protein